MGLLLSAAHPTLPSDTGFHECLSPGTPRTPSGLERCPRDRRVAHRGQKLADHLPYVLMRLLVRLSVTITSKLSAMDTTSG
jgi:hypothetical protein